MSKIEDKLEKDYLLLAIVASGVLLTLLFPIGLLNIHSIAFQIVFTLHLLLHITAILISIKRILFLASNSLMVSLYGLLVVAPILAIVVASSILPVAARDALIHHLAVPNWWLEAGRIYDIWWHEWSSYPMLIQLAYAGFLKWQIPSLTTLYHGSFLILIAGIISRTSNNVISQNGKFFGLIMVFTLPLFIKLAASPYVDLPLALYGLAVILFILSDKENTKLSAVQCGVLIGLLASTKYNGLLFAPLCIILSLIYKRQNIIWLILSAAVIAAPWYLKNYLLYDNPVYPLLTSIFPPFSEPLNVPQAGVSTDNEMLSYRTFFPGVMLQMLLFGKDDSALGFDGILSPLLLFALAFPLIKDHWKKRLVILLTCILYAYLALKLSGPRVRYFAPILGILILAAASGIDQVLLKCRKKLRTVLEAGLLLAISYLGLYYSVGMAIKKDLPLYLSGDISEEDYLKKQITEANLAFSINKKLSQDSKTLLLYTGNRYYLYKRPIINSGYISEKQLISWIKKSTNPEQILSYIKEHGITHIAIHSQRYKVSFEYFLSSKFLSQEEVTLWNTFSNMRLKPEFSVGPYQVWSVVDRV